MKPIPYYSFLLFLFSFFHLLKLKVGEIVLDIFSCSPNSIYSLNNSLIEDIWLPSPKDLFKNEKYNILRIYIYIFFETQISKSISPGFYMNMEHGMIYSRVNTNFFILYTISTSQFINFIYKSY